MATILYQKYTFQYRKDGHSCVLRCFLYTTTFTDMVANNASAVGILTWAIMWLPMACCCGVGSRAVWGGAWGWGCGCWDGQGSRLRLDWEAAGGGHTSGLTRGRPSDIENDKMYIENNFWCSQNHELRKSKQSGWKKNYLKMYPHFCITSLFYSFPGH